MIYTNSDGYEKLRKSLESSGATVNSGREISEKELRQLVADLFYPREESEKKSLWEQVQETNKGR